MPGGATLLFAGAALCSYTAMSLAPKSTVVALSTLIPAYAMSRFSYFPKIQYYLRLSTFLLGLAANSVWGVAVSIAMSLVGQGRNINYVVARSFWLSTSPLVGMRFTLEGEEHLATCPAILIGNHQTMLDILFLGRFFPKKASIMAKRELQWAPLLGQYMTLSKAVFINRRDRADALTRFAKISKVMKEKVLSLFIFVEGTRSASPTPTLLPFKKGAFHLAVASQLPIIPIVCENYAHAYSSAKKEFKGGDVVIRVLPPIKTEGYTSGTEDINKLVEIARAQMLETLESLTRERLEREKKTA